MSVFPPEDFKISAYQAFSSRVTLGSADCSADMQTSSILWVLSGRAVGGSQQPPLFRMIFSGFAIGVWGKAAKKNAYLCSLLKLSQYENQRSVWAWLASENISLSYTFSPNRKLQQQRFSLYQPILMISAHSKEASKCSALPSSVFIQFADNITHKLE